MTLDVKPFTGGIFAIQDNEKPEFAGGVASLHNSWPHTSPYPFDTMSLPEVGVSVQEQNVVVTLRGSSAISSAKWLNQTITELVKLLWLPRDWSSDKPKRIDPKAIEKILTVLLIILDPNSTPPIVVPTTQGGVQVEWHRNGIDLEIEVLESGELEFFFSGPMGEEEGPIGDLTTFKGFAQYL